MTRPTWRSPLPLSLLAVPLLACTPPAELDQTFATAASEAETSLPAFGVCEYFAFTGKPAGTGQTCNDPHYGDPIGPGMADPRCYPADDDENGVRYTCAQENGRLVWYRSLCKLDVLGADGTPQPPPVQLANECLVETPNYVRKDSFRGPHLYAAPDPSGSSQNWQWDGDWDVWYDNSGESSAAGRQNDTSQGWGAGKSVEINVDDTDIFGEPRDHGIQVVGLDQGSFGLKRSFAGDLRGKSVVIHYSLRLHGSESAGAWFDVAAYGHGEYAEAMAIANGQDRADRLAARRLWSELGQRSHTDACTELVIPADADRPLSELRFKLGAGQGANHQLSLYKIYIEDDPLYRGHACPDGERVETFSNFGAPVPFTDPRTGNVRSWRYDADWSPWFDNSGSADPTNESSQSWGTGYSLTPVTAGSHDSERGGQSIVLTEGSFGLKRTYSTDLRNHALEIDWSANLEALGGAGAAAWLQLVLVDDEGEQHIIHNEPFEWVLHDIHIPDTVVSNRRGQRIYFNDACVSKWIPGSIAHPVHEVRIKVGALGDSTPDGVVVHEVRTGSAAIECSPF